MKKDKEIKNFEVRISAVLDYYGEDAQMVQALQEMAELSKELTKQILGKENRERVVEEYVDVQIMMLQISEMFDIQDSEVIVNIRKQLERVEKRIAKEKAELEAEVGKITMTVIPEETK